MFGYQKDKKVPTNGIIDKPGTYYLDSDFFSNKMFAIKITSNNVTLDLNSFGVYTDLKDKSQTAFGIYAVETSGINIRNGKTAGSTIGIHAPYNKHLKIVSVEVSALHMGMNVGGQQVYIGNCYIYNIGGHKSEAYAIGINSVDMSSGLIEFNRIENIYRQNVPSHIVGEGVGILLGHDTGNCFVSKNTILNRDYRDNTYSMWAVGNKHEIEDNVFCNSQIGVYMGNSRLINNIIMLRQEEKGAIAVRGGMGICSQNTIINYPKDYCNETQEGVTEPQPFIIE